MPTCRLHGPHSGSRCHSCEVEDQLRGQARIAEEAERDAAHRYWEEGLVADQRARELQEHQTALVRDTHKIQAASLFSRARELLKAGLIEEAADTSREALQKDRGYLPAYALLGAAEYDTGNHVEACNALDKAIRLLGHGEWTTDAAYINILSRIEGRKFPDALLQSLRAKLVVFPGAASVDLLTWIASCGWSAEVLKLLPKRALASDDLATIASWLVSPDPGAASELIGIAVLQLAQEVKPTAWIEVTSLALTLELESGDSRHRTKLFEMTNSWPEEALLNALKEFSVNPEWKELTELNAEFVLGMLSAPIARVLNVREERYIEQARAQASRSSEIVSWIPAIKKRDLERSCSEALFAKKTIRESTLSVLSAAHFERFLTLDDQWRPSIVATEAVQVYFGESHFRRGRRLEAKESYAEAASAFSEAQKYFSLGSKLRQEMDAAHWQGWCLYSGQGSEVAWLTAIRCFGHAANLATQLAIPAEESMNLYWQAMCLEKEENPARDVSAAVKLYRKVIEADRLDGNCAWAAASHFRIGSLAESANRKVEALVEFRQAESCYKAAGDGAGQATAVRRIGFNLCPATGSAGDCADAIETFRRALELDQLSGERLWQVWDIFELAWCHKPSNNAHGSWVRAIELLQEAYQLALELGDTGWQAKCLFNIGWSLEPTENVEGSWQGAIDYYIRASEIAHLGKHDFWEAEGLNAAGWCYQPIHAPFGDWGIARECCERAAAAWRRADNKNGLARSLFNIAKSLSLGDREAVTPEGRNLFSEASRLFRDTGNETRAAEATEWATAGLPAGG